MSKKHTAEPLPIVVIGPCTDTQGADVAEAIGRDDAKELNAMVDRFLSWPLPKSVCSDLCVTNRDYAYPRFGTSLLTADEARAMLQHVLGDQHAQREGDPR